MRRLLAPLHLPTAAYRKNENNALFKDRETPADVPRQDGAGNSRVGPSIKIVSRAPFDSAPQCIHELVKIIKNREAYYDYKPMNLFSMRLGWRATVANLPECTRQLSPILVEC